MTSQIRLLTPAKQEIFARRACSSNEKTLAVSLKYNINIQGFFLTSIRKCLSQMVQSDWSLHERYIISVRDLSRGLLRRSIICTCAFMLKSYSNDAVHHYNCVLHAVLFSVILKVYVSWAESNQRAFGWVSVLVAVLFHWY